MQKIIQEYTVNFVIVMKDHKECSVYFVTDIKNCISVSVVNTQ